MQKIYLTYMTYKKRLSNNQINYATAAWHSEERANEMREQMLNREDVEDVFIQQQIMEDAPQIDAVKTGTSPNTGMLVAPKLPTLVEVKNELAVGINDGPTDRQIGFEAGIEKTYDFISRQLQHA